MPSILGINAYHADAAACLMVDGCLVAAAEEERFRRIKHWAGFPSEAILYCLDAGGLSLRDVEHVAINRDPQANLFRKVGSVLAHRPEPGVILERLRNQRDWSSIESTIGALPGGNNFHGRVHRVEHHLAHLSSAFLVSPFHRAVVVSVDGMGDFASAAWGIGEGSRIDIKGRVFSPHSLGIFYEALTQYVGFPSYGDEYKVMGLAPYGQPIFMPEMRRIVAAQRDGAFRLNLEFFRHHRERFGYVWKDCAPRVERLFTPALERLLGRARSPEEPLEQRHRDVAESVQSRYEEAFFALLNSLYDKFRIDTLALAGGCAMNSVANGKIYVATPFRRVFVQPAAGDAGGALGAALAVHHRLSPGTPRLLMEHAYWGPEFSRSQIAALIERHRSELGAQGCRIDELRDDNGLCRRAARAIAEGKVVGWFQGRMEWGPRALGNRSILCDPRRPDMKDILNLKIKRRESFRPFAPSILREKVIDWFETDDEVPFMMQVFQIKPEKRSVIPAVTHVDGSGRLQTITAAANPLYYRLVESFAELTGVPLVLNTSFNENEPIVCRPQEAMDCFLRTKMDLLALGPFVVERIERGQPPAHLGIVPAK
jgi:carbamoyltransferase